MASQTPTYGTPTALTITLASLANNNGLLAGRQSTVVDQKDVTDAIDVLIGGKIKTSATATNFGVIGIFAFGSYNDVDFPNVFGSTNANVTITSAVGLKVVDLIFCNGVASTTYFFGPKSLAQAFGGTIPVQWGIWVSHNSAGSLDSTAASHELVYIPVTLGSV